MDFSTIAESTSPKAIHRFLRSVTAVATAAEDDDFSHLDTSRTSHHDYQYQHDSILDNTVKKGMMSVMIGCLVFFGLGTVITCFNQYKFKIVMKKYNNIFVYYCRHC